MSPKVLVLRAPGTNCDEETAFAFAKAGGQPESLHVNRLLENPPKFAEFQILCLPGGFSYGDDLGSGRILGNQLRLHLADALREFKAAGKLILGICNGFQILMKAPGLLLDEDPRLGAAATLTSNDHGRYEDRWVRLRVASDRCVFTKGLSSLYLPIAHAEGKFVPASPEILQQLESTGQLSLRYQSAGGEWSQPLAYPENPNGSTANVAGLCDATGRVFGLMPHPERHLDPTHHPRWTRETLGEEGDGLAIFKNAVKYFM